MNQESQKTFYCIINNVKEPTNPEAFNLLKDAVIKRGLEFVPIEVDFFEWQKLNFKEGSAIYRIEPGSKARLIEAAIILNNPSKNLYKEGQKVLTRSFAWGSALLLEAAKLPIIPTLFLPNTGSQLLESEVKSLGGFPVVLKGAGGSHGSAVRKIESAEELATALKEKTLTQPVVRKFIHQARHIRVVVLGNQAIDAIEYSPQDDDFRTNAVLNPKVVKFDMALNKSVVSIAEKAVATIGLEFGGVDILLGKNQEIFIAEVNFPCNFARNQNKTGRDIAGAMVEYLLKKSAS